MPGLPKLPSHVENYLLCILLHMLLPLLPLGIEWWSAGSVSERSMTLGAAMYSIGIGVSSQRRVIFGIALVASLVFAIAFGLSAGQQPGLPKIQAVAIGGILSVFLLHAAERYNRHIVDRTPFFEFMDS